MDEDFKSTLKDWGIAQQWVDRLADEEVFDIQTLFLIPDGEIDRIISKAGPRAQFKAKMQEFHENIVLSEDDLTNVAKQIINEYQRMANLPFYVKQNLQANDSNALNTEDKNGRERQNDETGSDKEADVNADSTDCNGNVNASQDKDKDQSNPGQNQQENVPEPRIAPRNLNKRSSQPSEEESPLKRLCQSCLNGKLVLNYYKENGELNEDTRNLLAEVILNDYLKDDYAKKIPADEEKCMTNNILQLFPSEKREIWMSSDQRCRESAVGRGKILTRYYGKRRIMKKAGLMKKGEADKGNADNIENLADIDGDVNPTEFTEKLLWLTNTKAFSSRLTEYWKYTSKGRLRRFIAAKTPVAEYMNTYPALLEKTGYLLLETDYETLHEGSSMNFFVNWPALAAFVESKVPKHIKEGIVDAMTPEGKKILTVQALPYLFNVITAAKKGKNKQWRPSREECAESLLLHVLEPSAILTTLANRLKEKYEPFNLSLGPQAIVVGETVDSITKCYVRVNSILYEVDNPVKALDITFKIMHALDCQNPKESEREWFFLERSIYCINLDKRNPLIVKTSSACSEYARFKS
ncbi:hypothetical protein FOCC_FOCC013180 [Frankliniella occidentalis]|nr:hypothetical protein FOCC_FOCC013180 [Frankliniella occidentalis]